MRQMARTAAVLFLCTCFSLSPAGAQVLTTGALLLLLGQVKSAMETALITADAETAARLHQAEVIINGAIAKLDKSIDNVAGVTDNLRSRTAGDVATSLAAVGDLLQGVTSNVVEGVNNALVDANKTVTAIPLSSSVPTYITGVRPYSVTKAATGSVALAIHGYFPDVSEKRKAYVVVKDKTLPLDSAVGNMLSFSILARDLPAEEEFLPLQFVLPVKKLWGAYYEEVKFKANVYVRRSRPFDISFTVNGENPAIWSTVMPSRPFIATANSSQVSNIATVTAAQLFSTLVDNHSEYDISTATVTGWARGNRAAITDGISPCAEGCVRSSGTWSWSADGLQVSLQAPSCDLHWIYPSGFFEPRYQCSGGTHADFSNTPTFRVRKRAALSAEVVLLPKKDINMAHAAVSDPVPLPLGWTSVDILTRYRDGAKKSDTRARLTGGPTGHKFEGGYQLWSADAQGESLVITTR